MKRTTITCASCERMWTIQTNLSIYVQQAMESKPCPHCGACTLSCEDSSKILSAAPPPSSYWHALAG